MSFLSSIFPLLLTCLQVIAIVSFARYLEHHLNGMSSNGCGLEQKHLSDCGGTNHHQLSNDYEQLDWFDPIPYVILGAVLLALLGVLFIRHSIVRARRGKKANYGAVDGGSTIPIASTTPKPSSNGSAARAMMVTKSHHFASITPASVSFPARINVSSSFSSSSSSCWSVSSSSFDVLSGNPTANDNTNNKLKQKQKQNSKEHSNKNSSDSKSLNVKSKNNNNNKLNNPLGSSPTSPISYHHSRPHPLAHLIVRSNSMHHDDRSLSALLGATALWRQSSPPPQQSHNNKSCRSKSVFITARDAAHGRQSP